MITTDPPDSSRNCGCHTSDPLSVIVPRSLLARALVITLSASLKRVLKILLYWISAPANTEFGHFWRSGQVWLRPNFYYFTGYFIMKSILTRLLQTNRVIASYQQILLVYVSCCGQARQEPPWGRENIIAGPYHPLHSVCLEIDGVETTWGEVSPHHPTRGSGEHRKLPQWGPG